MMQAESWKQAQNIRRHKAYPFWLMRLLQSARYNLRRLPLAKRYPLAGELDGRKPLFIVSAGRSGTTLLRSMLVAGEQIAIPPESQIIHQLVLKFSSFQFAGWDDLSALMIANFEQHHHFNQWNVNLGPAYEIVRNLPQNQRSLARVIDSVYMTYGAERFPKAITWGDQSPIHTFYLSWIYRAFPNGKYLHLLRDGRDVISSFMSMEFKERGLDYAATRWLTSLQQVAEFRKNLAPEQFLEVRYENLVSNPEATLQDICRFLDIQYTPTMLDYWKLPSTTEHKHYEHHRNLSKPITTDSIGKWKERLTPEQQAYIFPRISDQLHQLGYPEGE